MQKENNRHNRLQWLAALTAVALAGIVCFQIYWLRNAYYQQQSYFVTDIRNAVNATVIRNKINATIKDWGYDGTENVKTKDIITFLSYLSQLNGYNNPTVSSSIKFGIREKDTLMIKSLPLHRQIESARIYEKKDAVIMYSMDMDSLWQQPKPANFDSLTGWLKKELRQRNIYAPAELALLDTNGFIIQCTTNARDFKNIPEKSEPSYYIVMAGTKKVRLQAAFPDAGLAVARRMIHILMLTLLLIILATVSFACLMQLFFRQKRLADVRNDFMNNMTHELQTPISSVSVALQMMQDERHLLGEEQRQEYLMIAQGELGRLIMLVEKVMKMAAFERSEISFAPELFSAAGWLTEIINSMQPVLIAAGAQMNTIVQPGEAMLYADKIHLTSVLHNLLENALKYNDKKTAEISISIVEEDNFVTLKVTDNGKGIAPAYLNKVFGKFFRVPEGNQHNTKGYGLGLSYVQAIAVLHGGSVGVESRPGEGSSFTVMLPKNL